MARNRQTKVTLVAEVSGYVNGMAQAAKATRETGSEAEKLAQKREAIDTLGTSLLAIGAVAAAGVGLAVARFAEFDQAISEVKASTQETTGNMTLLRQAALDFGASSIFTATEAANAIEELGKAGVSTADILGGALAGSLDLASAGGIGIARAAEISATTLQQFSLAGDQAGRVADVLAAGAGKALGSVDDLANGLKFVGPVAASMGVSLEETTGVLAAFAQAGIVGEQGGTSLRGMLASLTSPSKQARAEIEALGIQLYDSEGGFLGLENAAGQLSEAYSKMTDDQRDASLGVLFGNETVTAARVLYLEGAEGVREWTDAVDDSGYAGQVARDRLDNLRGDVEKLGGAFDTFLINSGSAANDALRALVQTAEFLVSAIGDAPQPVLDVGLALGAVTAAVGLVGGAALLGAPKVAAFKLALDSLNVSGRTAALGVGVMAGAVAGATLAIGYFVGRQADIKATTDTLVDTLDDATGAFTDYTRQAIAKKLADEGAFEAAREAGISQDELTDAVIAGGDALADVQAKLTGNNNIGTFFTGVGIRAGNAQSSIRDLRTAIDDSKQSFIDQREANEGSAAVSQTAAEAYQAQADEVTNLSNELKSLIDQINAANGMNQDAISANASWQAALAGVGDQIDEMGTSLDRNTESGSANAASLADVAAAAQTASSAQFEVDQSAMSAEEATRLYTERLGAQRQAFIDSAIQAGYNADEVHALADEVFQLPNEKEVEIIADTANASRDLNEFITGFAGRRIPLYVQSLSDRDGRPINMGQFAEGGAIYGPGGPKDDRVPILASNGEHMLDAGDVDAMGGQAAVYAFRESLHKGKARYAERSQPRYAPQPVLSVSRDSGGSGASWTLNQEIRTEDPNAAAQLAAMKIAGLLTSAGEVRR